MIEITKENVELAASVIKACRERAVEIIKIIDNIHGHWTDLNDDDIFEVKDGLCIFQDFEGKESKFPKSYLFQEDLKEAISKEKVAADEARKVKFKQEQEKREKENYLREFIEYERLKKKFEISPKTI